ncbi:MAG: pro-sigmaK processing inhibitor BofA family protein [Methanomicrobium sp.]|uniref:pro-sigmaK processing inhibitor BofA family protein n=1 Tax=Methanomicrobium mobile TaxID=2205 RepID=UPI0005B2E484|nr:pro-sigmaK processing inhibitor BofA family protein [Methanomicrobium mobile]MBP5083503.1 pro-sigmaK processing inhibitor BofA family protein [Methanomicrobium sp.]MBP5475160.1 pro-sigmaK processing inhibitor BofA family protein [Methanomicrobium sp.]MBQ3684184.1 pro-sigmaK processing inhibitor BofA family protein [Methanomicrobium sp.]MBQ3718723.1 pro-sigmaK processing inhibitor BofA family protein [Methanomicrobium sp.]MBQ4414773.1 pro-sigmaK processing inhibitor BofA family protein [Meth
MLGTLLTLVAAALILIVLWYFLKNLTTLIVNSILGIILLVLTSHLGILGMSGFTITWGSVLICALGGLPGAILLIVLNIAGIHI